MKKIFIFIAAIFSLNTAQAFINAPMVDMQSMITANAPANWTVGDYANYKMSIGSFLNGTMSMEVMRFDGTELEINQKLDLQIMQQDCTMVIDITTGETKSLVCNGQAQDTSGGNIEVIETRSEEVTVPAGTFNTTYIKAKETRQNSIMEQWADPYSVAVVGLVKMLTQSQMGEVKAVLTDFNKQ
tara:strand:- start:14163 stop:14717 length:555 start_codon:yes stop_codon:yes gene_type:complete